MAPPKAAALIWRDYRDPLNALLGVWEPDKAEIRVWTGWVEAGVDASSTSIAALLSADTAIRTRLTNLEAGQAVGRVVRPTWSTGGTADTALSLVPLVSGATGEVLDGDTGTHTGLSTEAGAVGTVIPNSGTYLAMGSPLAWRRIGPSTAKATADQVSAGLLDSLITGADVFDDENKPVVLALVDSNGRGPLYLTEDGSVVTGLISQEIAELEDTDILYARVDKNYRPFEIGYKDGSVYFPGGVRGSSVGSGGSTSAAARGAQVAPSIKYRLLYGQSLATGTSGLPLLSTTALYGTLMFAGGIRLLNNPDLTSFVNAVETQDSALGETGAVASAHQSSTYLAALLGLTPTTLGSNYFVASGGRGGAELSRLAKGSSYYTNMMTIPASALPIASGQSRTFGLSVIELIHGQADIAFGRTRLSYANGLVALRKDIEADTKAITGQIGVVPMLVSQAACQASYYKRLTTGTSDRAYPDALPTPEIDMAMMDAAAADPNIIVHMSLYSTGDIAGGDGIHRDGYDYQMIGRNRGRAAAKIEKALADGTPFPEVAVRPLSYIAQKRTARIKYSVPFGPLVLDETWVLPTFNKGFDVWDASGATPVLVDSITSVAIVGKDTIELKFSADLPTTWLITYAWGRNESADGGRSKGPRGNLRDSEGDSTVGTNNTYTDAAGVVRRLDNYALLHAISNKV